MKPAKLRSAREKLGLTQAEFWDAVGVSQPTGSRYEAGGAIPKTVIALLKRVYDLRV